jgi:leucyl aminopeptidase
MDTRLIISGPAGVETECLAVFVLDHGDKQKPVPKLAMNDAAVEKALAELFASGEITGKAFETVLLHRPQGLKAKRLLAVGGGKSATFSHVELRKAAGSVLRFLKPKMIRSCAIAVPELSTGAEDAVRSIVEGAYVADFDHLSQ